MCSRGTEGGVRVQRGQQKQLLGHRPARSAVTAVRPGRDPGAALHEATARTGVGLGDTLGNTRKEPRGAKPQSSAPQNDEVPGLRPHWTRPTPHPPPSLTAARPRPLLASEGSRLESPRKVAISGEGEEVCDTADAVLSMNASQILSVNCFCRSQRNSFALTLRVTHTSVTVVSAAFKFSARTQNVLLLGR